MLQLLQPAALWTLAALALPLAIHLRRPPPRTVRLGSLRFLADAPRRPLRNLRWRELILLAARLGLLAVLSLLLAGPRWVTRPPVGARRWALLDPTVAPAGESLERWHTARAAGYELRRLAPGFPLAADDPAPASLPAGAAAPDAWSLLQEADAELPGGSTLAVYSPSRLAELRGIRPALVHCRVGWVQTPDVDGGLAHEWVALASAKRVVAGRSDARGTTFVSRPPESADAGRPGALPALSVLILHDPDHAGDAAYAEAAVRAAADSAGRPVNLQNREITADAENAAVTDWTFWLTTRPVPAGLAARAPRIVRYAGVDPVPTADWIVAPDGSPADGARLWKRTAAAEVGVSRWTDAQGNPILSYARAAGGERWDLFTRLDPGWTDLPRTTALPAWLRSLLFPEIAAAAAGPLHDRRAADPAQGQPSDRSSTATVETLAPVDQPSRDLHWPLWCLAALLFAAERCLSLRRSARPPAAVPVARPEFAKSSR